MQRPYVGSTIMRRDSIDCPEGFTIEHRSRNVPTRTIHVRAYSGRASLGYQSNYQHRDAWWVEVEAMTPENRVGKYRCWRFTGAKAEAKADKAYREILGDLAKHLPGAKATFPTSAAPSV